jgi:hypothetical protein
MKNRFSSNIILLFVLFFIGIAIAADAARDPILIMDSRPRKTVFSGGIGPTFKYKRVSGPQDFGGDMVVWGIRAFGGNANEGKFGLLYSGVTLNGKNLKFSLKMAGLSYEDHFREDPRVKWRVSFGGGSYELKSRFSSYVVNDGSFTFIEPMIIGVLSMTRHIVLEFGAGYTFAGATGVRIEGLALQAEFLLGKF